MTGWGLRGTRWRDPGPSSQEPRPLTKAQCHFQLKHKCFIRFNFCIRGLAWIKQKQTSDMAEAWRAAAGHEDNEMDDDVG